MISTMPLPISQKEKGALENNNKKPTDQKLCILHIII